MYLKALEIQGFKSFPDKTVLTFGEDITAIVGPNGSGKSNISDAIRWVMGEQSCQGPPGRQDGGRDLRRHRQAAPDWALPRSPWSWTTPGHIFYDGRGEVVVTRRYYRSRGERILYQPPVRPAARTSTSCSWTRAWAGRATPSSARAGSTRFCPSKSGDRREVFEEAAGISKYRHRKEETERKLERTEENLLRISDKISELELQVEPLRVQAEKARKYLVLRDELQGAGDRRVAGQLWTGCVRRGEKG